MIWAEICPYCNQFSVKGGHPVECGCRAGKVAKNESFYVPKTEEIFNRGLGVRTYSTRDAERKAKQLSSRLSERENKRITITPTGSERFDAPMIQKQRFDVKSIIEKHRRRLAS